MDLIKTMLVYMMLMVGASTSGSPVATPRPATPTPAVRAVTSAPVITATPPAYTALTTGSRGDHVTKLQQRLKDLGYYSGTIDGQYGQQTRRAVEQFQQKNGLEADGAAGVLTQELLYDDSRAIAANSRQTPVPTATPLAAITVPIYYVDANGRELKRVDMVLYNGTSTIYANGSGIPSGYTLVSEDKVKVTVKNGKASPASITFRYQAQPAATATPTKAPAKTTKAPTKTPAPTRTPKATQAPKTTQKALKEISVPVFYVIDSQKDRNILLQDAVTLPVGTETPVYPDQDALDNLYELTAEAPLLVKVDADGNADPAMIIFTCRLAEPAATPEPTAEPTAQPTATPEPTTAPTAEPTATPEPTTAPTAEPTATPEPTAAPTAEPAATPEPTETPEPIVDTTAEPTATPQPTPEPVIDVPGLALAGDAATLNGVTQPFAWYQDEERQLYVSLQALCDALQLPYIPNQESVLAGHYVHAVYDSGLIILTVDEQDFLEDGWMVDGDLLVSRRFLQALGAEVHVTGGQLSIELTEN